MSGLLKGSIHMIRRIFVTLLAALLLLLAPASASLAQELMIGEGELELYSEGAFPEPPVLRQARFSARTKTVEQVIYEGIMDKKVSINISDYSIQAEDLESLRNTLKAIIQNVVNNEPDIFFIDKYYNYGYYMSGDQYVAASISPIYLYTGEELEREIAAYNSAVNAIVADARKADTVVGQLLRANDYLCLNFEYDTRANSSDENVKAKAVRKPNEFFKQGKGVCQAYTLAFKAVCDRLGLTSTTASSDELNHIWNMVNVGGEWYHIDVTWNDPVPDSKLFAHHKNFMRSDEGISDTDHHSWASSVSATSTKYDSVGWLKLGVPLSVVGDTVYYTSVDTESFIATIRACDLSSLSDKAIYDYQIYSYSSWGVPCAAEDGRIYFAEDNVLHSVDDSGEDCRVEFTLFDESAQIRSMLIDDEVLTLRAANGSGAKIFDVPVGSKVEMVAKSGEISMKPNTKTLLEVTFRSESEEGYYPITYTSDKPFFVSIVENEDGKGEITANLYGEAVITANYFGNSDVDITIRVRVHRDQLAVVPADTKEIRSAAFMGMPVEEFYLPDGVEKIGSCAFSGCDDLMYINLPASLTEIAGDAFDGDSTVTLIVDEGSAAHSFAKGSGLKTIVVPAAASADEYAAENTVIAE